MEELTLSRYRAQNPPSKTVAEARRVKTKVTNSDKKRRLESMKMDRREMRLAEMDREIALNELKDDSERMKLAQRLNERAEEYMQAHGTDYTTALREVVKLSESGASEPSVREVERYMKENAIDDFGRAVREVAATRGDQGLAGVSIGGVNIEQENRELEKAIKERGYELHD